MMQFQRTAEIVSIRDIACGEEACICYVNYSLSRSERRQQLYDGWGFWCDCEFCGADESVPLENINLDPRFTDSTRLHIQCLEDSLALIYEERVSRTNLSVLEKQLYSDTSDLDFLTKMAELVFLHSASGHLHLFCLTKGPHVQYLKTAVAICSPSGSPKRVQSKECLKKSSSPKMLGKKNGNSTLELRSDDVSMMMKSQAKIKEGDTWRRILIFLEGIV